MTTQTSRPAGPTLASPGPDSPNPGGSAPGWGERRSRTVAWHDPGPTALVGLDMAGIDYLRAMWEGRLPASPIAELVGLRPESLADGELSFRCRPDESFYNPVGIVHGGLLCTLLDSATASAVHSTLPAGVAFTTIELKVSYLRAVRAGQDLLVTGRVTKRGRRVSFAEAEAVDEAGKLVASATSSILLV